MSGFIEIIPKWDKKRRFINIRHIEEVVEVDENTCRVFMAFNVPDATEQDYFEVDKPYDEIISMIKKGGVQG